VEESFGGPQQRGSDPVAAEWTVAGSVAAARSHTGAVAWSAAGQQDSQEES
jgi:hypothetical protein